MVDGRRFCDSCEKVVTDLTRCTREEAEAWARANPGGCARLPTRWTRPSLAAVAGLGLALNASASPADYQNDEGEIEYRPEEKKTAELSASANGFDASDRREDAEALVRLHPAPFRKVLDRGGVVEESVWLVVDVAPNGAVRSVTSEVLELHGPEFTHALAKIQALQFPSSTSGGTVTVWFGPKD